MSEVLVGLLVGVCVFSGALLGMFADRFLPKHHLTKETQDVVRLGTGTVSVLASLVLGLLIATAKTTSDTADREMRAYATDTLFLDWSLREYGPEAMPARTLLTRYTRRVIGDIWPTGAADTVLPEEVLASTLLSQAVRAIRDLVPTTPAQHWQRDTALQTANTLLRQRWLMVEQSGPTVQPVIVVILVGWVTAIFASFGLNAPKNGTVISAFLICALAIGAAMYLVLEMDSPFYGLLRVTDVPMRRALVQLER